jgi:hypothetical protein
VTRPLRMQPVTASTPDMSFAPLTDIEREVLVRVCCNVTAHCLSLLCTGHSSRVQLHTGGSLLQKGDTSFYVYKHLWLRLRGLSPRANYTDR